MPEIDTNRLSYLENYLGDIWCYYTISFSMELVDSSTSKWKYDWGYIVVT